MSELLCSTFARLKKNKTFWACMAFMLLMGTIVPILHFVDMKHSGYTLTLESGFFACSIFIAILMSIFSSLFVGTEYSDGTMRNKITVGHARGSIYFANLIVCLTAGLLMCSAYWIPYLCVGIPLLGFFEAALKPVLLCILGILIMMVAYTAIFLFIAMLNQNKAIAAVICILSAFFLLFWGMSLTSSLSEPEYYSGYTYIQSDGTTITKESEANPDYLRGTKRDMYEFLYDATPGGQAIQFSSMKVDQFGWMALYSACIVVVATGGGVAVFRRKNLK